MSEETGKRRRRFEREGGEDDEGGTSVREPKRPKPKAPSGGAGREIPKEEEKVLISIS